MDTAVELLKKQLENKSQGDVAAELGISKTSVNLLVKGTYPNPKKMHARISNRYGDDVEIIGVSVSSVSELEDVAKMMGELL